ncbi:hypothetical protein LINPERPRIM_LOCUS36622 [Linum perenne]
MLLHNKRRADTQWLKSLFAGNSNGKCSNRRWAGDGLLVAQVITKLTDDIGPPSRKGIVLVKTRYSKSSFV